MILANGEEHPIEGKTTLFASRNGRKHQIEVNVVKGGGYEPILSKQMMLDMNLMQILDSDHLGVVKIDSDPLLDEYADVFKGLGKLAGQYKITVDEIMKPVFHPPRRLPVAIIERVPRKHEEMTTDGIIEKVNQPPDWVSSMLVVSKPSTKADGKIRICFGSNVAIKREHFPMPTIEEIVTSLNGANCLVYLMPVMVFGRWN